MKVCIIGSGASGITVAKALRQHGVAFDWFEKGSAVGGMWRYDNDSGTSSAYRSLQIDTSSRSLSYPDFPVPEHWPPYLRHEQVLEYLESYARHFGVLDDVTTSTEVTSVEPLDGGRWSVTTATGTTGVYDAVVVANGHLSVPRTPEVPGDFDGTRMHSHHYRTPEEFTGKRVVVVGIGNSACDIAVDLARVAEQVHLSVRRSAWILPKYLFGRPTDHWGRFFSGRLKLPTRLSRTAVRWVARLASGGQERFGLPGPPHKVHQAHGTVSQELLPYIAYDWIRVHPTIERFDGGEVVFSDGTRVRADAVIHATGYDTSFPFLPDDVVDAARHGERLYRRMVHPDRPTLLFAGLVQPVGPTIPLVEVQGRWIARVLTGAVPLPRPAAMESEIAAHRRWVAKTFVGSPRHRLEVDFRDHVTGLAKDMETAS
ncbi:cation diffusion facilitator CzcD-associated flavoprotein CzcO [Pseudonocardia sediminis]|uniref:Cation diffusion facilitator CzcD-associated flavoprotein CzcO n=1 Tax=Pseudonocardia sediminis TaxID=1397368 RepID=A0A4Q7V542_PSEST|nr:NAD(P)-binding domain-containing protein [Pseudonocardia sediminis]RZT88681.1 cation diffusion facilitator CzcD-associated flavoprotein CzcO [Pseudonocardia sediminis]